MNPDCQRVLELLDLAADRALSDAEATMIAEHARACRECAALLSLHRHLDLGPAAALEASVPEATASAVWERLAAAMEEEPRARTFPTAARAPRAAWPRAGLALAAAAIALALVAGWLGADNHRLRARVTALEELAATPATEPRTSPGEPARGPEPGGALWGGRAVTAGELTARLRELPPDAQVLPAGAVERLLRDRRPSAFATPRRGALADAARSGLRAGEALALLAQVDPGTRLPVNRWALRDLPGAGVH